MAFVLSVDDVQLPTYMERGFKGGPGFSSTILTGATSSIEQVVINQTVSRGQWTAAFGLRQRSFWSPILTLALTQRGQGYGFKFQDWMDYQVTNQILGTGDGATTDFQAKKVYDSGVRTYTRNLYLTDSTTRIVSLDGTPTSDYTMQPGGIIRFTSAPAGAVVVTLTSNFFMPVRFAEDHLEFVMQLATTSSELVELPAITLIEKLPSSL